MILLQQIPSTAQPTTSFLIPTQLHFLGRARNFPGGAGSWRRSASVSHLAGVQNASKAPTVAVTFGFLSSVSAMSLTHQKLETQTSVYISSEMNMRARFLGWFRNLRLKAALQHVGLLIMLMVYTVMGGLIFRRFEYPAEISKLSSLNSSIHLVRRVLLEDIIKETSNTTNWDEKLEEYELVLNDACNTGFPILQNRPDQTPEIIEKWTILKAVFFSSTVLTTIGYGNIVPMTTSGKAFCMVFALVGIPLTLTVIADWGRLFATVVSALMRRIPPLPPVLRNATVARRTSSYALSAVCFLFVYLAAGAGVFMIWEDWTFFDGFYFCFITMTTIGFGDLVPKKPKYMLLCTLYILVGLALTSTIIELVRRQYAQSWRQLQALSGPLADNLRKLAENAPGLDITAFQQDLRKVLTVVTMSRKSGGQQDNKGDKKLRQKEWEEAVEAVIRDITVGAANKQPPPILQIVIYESSV